MPEEKNNELAKSETGKSIQKRSLFAGKKVGLAAKLEETKITFDPHKMEHRIGLIADDSGSMGGQPIEDAKTAIGEFLHACSPQNTAVALYGFSERRKWKLTVDLVTLDVLKNDFRADQGTPLFTTMEKMIKDNPDLTRCVIFSDGDATDGTLKSVEQETVSFYSGHDRSDVVEQYQAAKVIVDTVFITDSPTEEHTVLKEISNRTGGMHLKFKPGAFAKAFKYLAPAFRGYLEDPNFKKQIGAE